MDPAAACRRRPLKVSRRQPAKNGNLHHEKAFDLKEFSEWATLGKIVIHLRGGGGLEVAQCYAPALPLPPDVKPNGKVLYMATPLINKPESLTWPG